VLGHYRSVFSLRLVVLAQLLGGPIQKLRIKIILANLRSAMLCDSLIGFLLKALAVPSGWKVASNCSEDPACTSLTLRHVLSSSPPQSYPLALAGKKSS